MYLQIILHFKLKVSNIKDQKEKEKSKVFNYLKMKVCISNQKLIFEFASKDIILEFENFFKVFKNYCNL